MLEKVHNGSIDGTLSAKHTLSYAASGTDHNAIVESLDPIQEMVTNAGGARLLLTYHTHTHVHYSTCNQKR